ncbi:AMP-binding protein [Peribacillus castrilensis]|uniref:Long-chain-fatty-acid--CoA ligase n=1 Tax=Peribacillus simplex TaxID=1478 RepID=A0AAN2PH82_9BACI|nr:MULTISPECIES: AMP-binding protein [Bacillaceae]MCP1094262.1 AMP-binding protein [Bacillaceae bacterium OS4b]MCF7622347.1 AMP-binding protein [Peribacillus frigoritolerans]MCP1152918.1 AMP-binding protein [Peribacillus frigoritolerans]MCT1388637.1 AMP-binding protein [Peribacillus frigoritolerans]MEA3574744.1 AMP-binding protein [Peribacillus frigoritolerans]
MKLETILTQQYVEKYQDVWPNRTILDYLNDAIVKHPEKIAIIDKKSSFTYKQLGKLVDRIALGLLHIGLGKGDVVSFQLPNWNEFIILHYAVTRIGAISNPLIPIYRDREIGYMVGMAESKMIVVPDYFRGFYYPDMIERLSHQWPSMKHIYVIGENAPNGMKLFSSLFDEPWEDRMDSSILDEITHDPNEVTEIIFTSGTTGSPKGVMHTHNTLCISTNYWIDRLHLKSDDVLFMASTFAHQTGFGYGVRLPTHIGGTGIYQDIWNPREFIEWVEKEKITFTAGATPFLQDTVQMGGIERYDLNSLRVFVALGAPIPRHLVKEAVKKVPFKILSGWGQTEDGLVTLTRLEDTEEKLTNTDGIPFPGMELKIVDFEGEICAPNIEGSLLVRGPALFVGYFKRINDTLAEYSDGWFITGDRAFIDEDGYIRISGRNKDIIIRGGENIPVAYVENVLYEHPDISSAQVIAVPDSRLQEKACACISMKTGKSPITMDSMQEFLLGKGLAKQYWPEFIEIMDDFPRTASGKIQKFRLREMINERITDNI